MMSRTGKLKITWILGERTLSFLLFMSRMGSGPLDAIYALVKSLRATIDLCLINSRTSFQIMYSLNYIIHFGYSYGLSRSVGSKDLEY